MEHSMKMKGMEHHSSGMKDMHTHHSEEMHEIHQKANKPNMGHVEKQKDHAFYGHFKPSKGHAIKTTMNGKRGGYPNG